MAVGARSSTVCVCVCVPVRIHDEKMRSSDRLRLSPRQVRARYARKTRKRWVAHFSLPPAAADPFLPTQSNTLRPSFFLSCFVDCRESRPERPEQDASTHQRTNKKRVVISFRVPALINPQGVHSLKEPVTHGERIVSI